MKIKIAACDTDGNVTSAIANDMTEAHKVAKALLVAAGNGARYVLLPTAGDIEPVCGIRTALGWATVSLEDAAEAVIAAAHR
jgi:hypothetical protein